MLNMVTVVLHTVAGVNNLPDKMELCSLWRSSHPPLQYVKRMCIVFFCGHVIVFLFLGLLHS